MLDHHLSRFLVRRRRASAALASGGLADPVTLSRLGLHLMALRGFRRDPDLARAHPAEHIAALAACGRADEARAAGARARPNSAPPLATALAALDPQLALSRYAGSRLSLRAGLVAAGGRAEDAAALAAAAPGTDAEARLLEAHLRRAEPAAAAAAWRAAFATWGLSPPEPAAPTDPVSVCNAVAQAGDPVDGGLVSVIMPTRNAARHVAAAVRSVLDQTWRSLELLFVDDASDDDTIRRAEAAAAGDPRFVLLRRTARGGAYRARNLGLAHARGRWIAFQDSDEWAHPRRLATQIADMDRRGLTAASARSIRVDDQGGLRARSVWPLARWAPSTLIFEREPVLARAGAFDAVLTGADNEYWWRLVQLFGPGRVASLRIPLILGAWRSDSLTGAADSGFGQKGYNLDRVRYWQAWRLWHLRNRRTPEALRLTGEERPFPAPAGIRL